MIPALLNAAFGFILGLALEASGVSFSDPLFWVILLPTVLTTAVLFNRFFGGSNAA